MAYVETSRGPLRQQNQTAHYKDSGQKGYYSNGNSSSYYGSENIYTAHNQYAQQNQTQVRRQYKPFPLTLPNSTPTPQPRGLPRQGSPGVYQNVPQPQNGSRVRVQPATPFIHNGSSANGTIKNPYAADNGNVILTQPQRIGNGNVRREQPLIWSVTTDPITQVRRSTPPRFSNDKSRQTVANRSSKPRWGSRFVQSLCCCMAPQQEIEPVKQAPPLTNPGLIITQVNKNGTTTTAPPTSQLSESEAKAQNSNGVAVSVSNGSSNGYSQNLQHIIEPFKPSAEKLLLPPLRPLDAKKKCLIIDLDETLVHSSFKPVKNPDFVIPVEIDGVVHQVYVLKRPFVDEFLAAVGDKFECVLFTASLAKYADPVADLLDKKGVFRSRLFREACVFHKGNYVKDLARLGRDLNKTLIMDNSPASYAFHPENAIAVQTWFDDPHDVELLDVLPLLDRLATVDSVYTVLRQSESPEPHDRSPS